RQPDPGSRPPAPGPACAGRRTGSPAPDLPYVRLAPRPPGRSRPLHPPAGSSPSLPPFSPHSHQYQVIAMNRLVPIMIPQGAGNLARSPSLQAAEIVGAVIGQAVGEHGSIEPQHVDGIAALKSPVHLAQSGRQQRAAP